MHRRWTRAAALPTLVFRRRLRYRPSRSSFEPAQRFDESEGRGGELDQDDISALAVSTRGELGRSDQ